MPDAAWFLMMVDAANRRVFVQSYDARHFPAAQAEYLRLEAEHEGEAGISGLPAFDGLGDGP